MSWKLHCVHKCWNEEKSRLFLILRKVLDYFRIEKMPFFGRISPWPFSWPSVLHLCVVLVHVMCQSLLKVQRTPSCHSGGHNDAAILDFFCSFLEEPKNLFFFCRLLLFSRMTPMFWMCVVSFRVARGQ